MEFLDTSLPEIPPFPPLSKGGRGGFLRLVLMAKVFFFQIQ
jgi:hypothetical protein